MQQTRSGSVKETGTACAVHLLDMRLLNTRPKLKATVPNQRMQAAALEAVRSGACATSALMILLNTNATVRIIEGIREILET